MAKEDCITRRITKKVDGAQVEFWKTKSNECIVDVRMVDVMPSSRSGVAIYVPSSDAADTEKSIEWLFKNKKKLAQSAQDLVPPTEKNVLRQKTQEPELDF